jgi:hypothetical protein
MGPLANALAVLGLLAGFIVAKLAKPELKPGQKYFIILRHALISAILGIILWKYNHYAAGLAILFFIILWKFSFEHQPVPMAVLLGILSTYFNLSILIFLYFIPTGTLIHNDWKKLLATGAVYLIAFAIATIF